MKPRIVMMIVTDSDRWDFSTVKGREMSNGRSSPGPTKKQFEIAFKALRNLVNAPNPPEALLPPEIKVRHVKRQTTMRGSKR